MSDAVVVRLSGQGSPSHTYEANFTVTGATTLPLRAPLSRNATRGLLDLNTTAAICPALATLTRCAADDGTQVTWVPLLASAGDPEHEHATDGRILDGRQTARCVEHDRTGRAVAQHGAAYHGRRVAVVTCGVPGAQLVTPLATADTATTAARTVMLATGRRLMPVRRGHVHDGSAIRRLASSSRIRRVGS